MKSKLLLWLLLLCSGSAWAQNLSVQESFEDVAGNSGEGSRYTSNSFIVGTTRYFIRASDPVTVNGTQTFGNSGSVQMTGEDGTYFWACEGVRSSTSGTTPAAGSVPGTVTLAGIPNTQNYTDLKITVAAGDPRNGSLLARDTDHLNVQYCYGSATGPFTTVGEFTNTTNPGNSAPWNRKGVGSSSPQNTTTLGSTFTDHVFPIPAGSGLLYVRIEADFNGPNKELAFDNIRVTGTASTVAKPTIVSNNGNSTLTFAEGTAAPLTVFDNLTLGNPAMASNPTLDQASVTITPDAGTQDVLTYTLPAGITAAVSTAGSSRTITFTGTANLSTYETLLESVKYKDTDANNATGGDRKFSFVVTANNVASIPLERIITVTTALNGPTLLSSQPNSTYIENFDTDGEGTRYGSNTKTVVRSTVTLGFVRLTGASGGSATPGANYNTTSGAPNTYTNVQGTGYWYTNATRGVLAGNVGTVKLAPVNTTGFTNLHFKIKAGAGTNTFNSSDFLRFSYSLDGGQTWPVIANYTGSDVTGQSQLRLNGNAANPALSTVLADLDFALPATVTGSAVEFQVEASVDADEIVFDNIQITGTQQPTVTTAAAATITTTNAVLGGNVTADGGGTVTDRGVVYVAGSGTPTTANTKVQIGSGTGTFSQTVSGLTAGTQYTVAAYAINVAGTSYGSNVTFTTTPNAPVVTAPANGSTQATATPTYSGTAQAGSTVTVYVDGTSIGTTTATGGSFSLAQPTALSQGSHTVYATATVSGSAASANSNTNTFTVDTVRPSVAITSPGNTNGGTTNTTPIPFTVTFTENVTGFVQGDVSVTNGTISGFTAVNGSTYTFNVTPTTPGTATTVGVPANVAVDPAGNGNTSGGAFSVTYNVPAATVTSVTRLMPSPTATAQVSYRVVFSGSVSGLTVNNFAATVTSGTISGASIFSVSGSGTTYTVVVNTGSSNSNGTLRLDVVNSTGTTPTITNVPYTAGEEYTIIKSFAAAPTLRIQAAGSATGNPDVTAFVDVVQVLSGGAPFTNGLQNGSFETNNVPTNFKKTADGVVANFWSFTGLSGISRNGGDFASTAADGTSVALIQSAGDNNASISQNLAVPTGTYQVSFQAIERNYSSKDQRLNVFLVQGGNTVFIGNIQPNGNTPPTYDTFTSASFNVTAPVLVATVSTTSASPTSTAPIPFRVDFTAGGNPQSVGTSFTASDVTVTGGTLNTASFSGSGAGPYTFTVTPSGAGTVTVSLAAGVAQDANNTGNAASNSVSVQFVTPTIAVAPVTLTGGTRGTAYSQTITASGGTAPYTYAITAGALPSGLTLSTAGVLSGTPAASGTFPFTVTATDASATPGPYSGSRSYTLAIAGPAITLAPATLPNGTVAAAYSQTLTASGGTAPYTYAITAGALPAGLTLTSAGVLSGTPTAGGSFPFTVTATDASTSGSGGPYTGSLSYTLNIVAPTITVAPATLPDGTRGTAYSQTITASGGTAPYTYAITAGALPSGLTLTSAGVLSGTPAASGTFPFTVTATDASSGSGPYTGSRSYTLTVAAPTITIAPATLPNGTVATAYSQTITASGGTAPYTYVITAGALPAGLTLTSAGALSGTPTAGGTFNFTVTATDASTSASGGPYSGSRSYTLTVAAPTIAVAPATLPNGTVGVAYSQALTASGGTTPYAYAITAGALPSGLTLSTAGVLSGTPAASGSFPFTVTATDASTGSGPYTGSRSYTLTVAAPTITIAPATLPNGTQGTAYSQTLTASGGTAPYSYAITAGALPSGLTLASNGTLAGTPTVNGPFTFTVTATDAFNSTGAQAYTLVIAAPASVSWTGTNSTNWFDASNWAPNTVPDATIDVIIPTSPSGSRFPIIVANASLANARNVSIASGASLSMSANTLTIAANLTNNGTFRPTGGTVVLGSTTASSILGSSNTRFWNLTAGPSGAQSSTSASTSVQRLLTLNGNFITNGNPFTLESDVNGTAMVINNGSAVVNGTATVQRYIQPDLNPGLGYRHVAAPITSATVASLTTASFTPTVNAAYNTSPTPSFVRPFPTVYGYDQSRLATASSNLSPFEQGWFSPAATTDALTPGKGYTVMTTANQTWNFTGTLGNGTLTQTLARNSGATAANSGLHLVGNPYPSPLDLSQVATTDRINLDQFVAVWASNDPTNRYAGAYAYYNNGLGTAGPVVALGQGFFTRVTPGQTSGTLTFRNSQRATSYQSPTYHRTAETRPVVQLGLQATGSSTVDNAFVYFEQGATAAFDSPFDAPKMPNPSGLNLSSSFAGSERLAINGLTPLGASQVVVPLQVGVPAAGSYTLQAAQLLNLSTTPTYLRDLQTGAVIDLAQQPSYLFTVSDASILIQGRFELVFSPQQVLATASAALTQQVALYPTPAKQVAFLELPASLGRQAITATLLDALGRNVRTVVLPAQGSVAHQLDLRELATGVYALRLHTSAGVVVKRLVVE